MANSKLRRRNLFGRSPMDHDQNFKNLIYDSPLQALAFFAAAETPDDID